MLLAAFAANAAITRDDVCGTYDWNYQSMLDWDSGMRSAKIEITPGNNPRTVFISGLYLDYTLVADVDNSTGNVSIRCQSLDYDFSYGSLKVYRVKAGDDGFEAVQEPIVGHFSDGFIEFDEDDMIGVGYPDFDDTMFFLLAADNVFVPYVDQTFVYNPEEWKSLGKGTLKEGWLGYHYLGGWEAEPYEVQVQENLADPNLICIVNPFDNELWAPYNQDKSAQGQIVIDIADPEFVKVQPYVYSGFSDAEFGKLYMYSSDSHFFYVEGWSEDAISSQLSVYVSKLDNKTITIPDPAFGTEQRPVGYYGWNSQPAMLTLPTSNSVAGFAPDANVAAPEYFDLQGRRILKPEKGIYVERRGSSVKKILK